MTRSSVLAVCALGACTAIAPGCQCGKTRLMTAKTSRWPPSEPQRLPLPMEVEEQADQEASPPEGQGAVAVSRSPRAAPAPPGPMSPEEWLARQAAAAWSGARDQARIAFEADDPGQRGEAVVGQQVERVAGREAASGDEGERDERERLAGQQAPLGRAGGEQESGDAAGPAGQRTTVQDDVAENDRDVAVRAQVASGQEEEEAARRQEAGEAASSEAQAEQRAFEEQLAARRRAMAQLFGAGSGFTGASGGAWGYTGMGAGAGYTGMGAGSGYTGITAVLPPSLEAQQGAAGAGTRVPGPSIVVLPVFVGPWGAFPLY